MPDSIRIRIVKYSICKGMNPFDYYTTKFSRLKKVNNEGCIGLVRIGALRDLYYASTKNEMRVGSSVGDSDDSMGDKCRYMVKHTIRVGSSGGDGDDIWVIFDNKFEIIKRIINTE